jgi:hypothetical protein
MQAECSKGGAAKATGGGASQRQKVGSAEGRGMANDQAAEARMIWIGGEMFEWVRKKGGGPVLEFGTNGRENRAVQIALVGVIVLVHRALVR